MKKEKVPLTLTYDAERLDALRLFLAEKNMQIEEELAKSLDALYGKTVPPGVRHYLDLRSGAERPVAKPQAREQVQRSGEPGDRAVAGRTVV